MCNDKGQIKEIYTPCTDFLYTVYTHVYAFQYMYNTILYKQVTTHQT